MEFRRKLEDLAEQLSEHCASAASAEAAAGRDLPEPTVPDVVVGDGLTHRPLNRLNKPTGRVTPEWWPLGSELRRGERATGYSRDVGDRTEETCLGQVAQRADRVERRAKTAA